MPQRRRAPREAWSRKSFSVQINFPTGRQRTPDRQARKLGEVVDLVKEGEMPLWSYPLLHPAARLTDAQQQLIVAWGDAERARLQASGVVAPSAGKEGTEEGEEQGGEEASGREEGNERGERGQR